MTTKIIIDRPVEMLRLLNEYKAAGMNIVSALYQEFIELDSDDVAAVRAIYDKHPDYTPAEIEQRTAQSGAVTGYAALPDWARIATADSAETYINGQIWNGADIAAVEAYIDTQIGTVTGTSLATALTSINAQLAGVRAALKAAAGAIIAMRGLFALTAKLLIYIRDLVIRWR